MAETSADSATAGQPMESNEKAGNFESEKDSTLTDQMGAQGGTPTPSTQNPKPTCIVVLGMAGSGKTSFVQAGLNCQT